MTRVLPSVTVLPRVPLFVWAVLSSVVLSLALRPWGFGALALLAFIPVMIAVSQERSWWKAGLYSYLTMLGGVWVALEGLAREFTLVFILGVFVFSGVFAFVGISTLFFKRFFGSRAILLFPIIWVALEFLISQPVLLGSWANPIMAIGYTQFDTSLLQATRWSGVTGVSFLVLLFNAVLAFIVIRWLEQHQWKVISFLPLLLVLLLSSLAVFLPVPSSTAKGKAFRVGIAQAYLPTLEYTIADFDSGAQAIIANRYKILLEQLVKRGAQMVVLPETALGGWYADFERNELLLDTLRGVSLALVGVKTAYVDSTGNREGRNAILEFQREANRIREVYAKQIPIPLTEGGFNKGKNLGLVRLGGVVFGLGICWENTFPGLARASVLGGAEVLVYQNSLLWAGATATPVLHQRISAFRAVETGRMVIHATAGGSSALIDATGKIIEAAPQSLETTLIGLVQPRVGLTPFVQFGDWFGVLCVALTIFTFVLAGIKRLKPR